MALRYIMLKIRILASGRKWRHWLNSQCLSINFNIFNKKYCVAWQLQQYTGKMWFYNAYVSMHN